VWWGHDDDSLDPLTQVHYKTVSVDIMARSGGRYSLSTTTQLRHYTAQELSLLAQVAGFEVRRPRAWRSALEQLRGRVLQGGTAYAGTLAPCNATSVCILLP
jgi:hypothetical protein